MPKPIMTPSLSRPFEERIAGFFERCLLDDAQDLPFVHSDGIQHLLRT